MTGVIPYGAIAPTIYAHLDGTPNADVAVMVCGREEVRGLFDHVHVYALREHYRLASARRSSADLAFADGGRIRFLSTDARGAQGGRFSLGLVVNPHRFPRLDAVEALELALARRNGRLVVAVDTHRA